MIAMMGRLFLASIPDLCVELADDGRSALEILFDCLVVGRGKTRFGSCKRLSKAVDPFFRQRRVYE